jgi:hypothetical protein
MKVRRPWFRNPSWIFRSGIFFLLTAQLAAQQPVPPVSPQPHHPTQEYIYLEQKKPDLARAEVEKAVKLAPNYAEAKELLEHLGKSKPTGGEQ